MEIDHLFIFSKAKGKEADALVDFGFFKGSRRMIKKLKQSKFLYLKQRFRNY